MKVSAKHRIEYAALRAVGFVFTRLPYRLALAAAWPLAWLAHYGFRWRRREARARIREVFPDMPERDVRSAAWRSMRNLCFNAVDVMRIPRLTPSWVKRRVTFTGWEHYEAVARAGKGGIFSVPHIGCWDLGGIAAHLSGMPMFFLAARQRNPLFDAYLNRMRGATGVETLLRDQPLLLRTVLRNLQAGKWLGVPYDLRAPTQGLTIDFLGKKANLNPGIAVFARRADVPMLPSLALRKGWTRHEAIMFPAVYADPDVEENTDLHRMVQQVMDVFTEVIRQNPDQYFWYNKRWVLDPWG